MIFPKTIITIIIAFFAIFWYLNIEPTYRMLPDERPELRDVKRILRSTLEGKKSQEKTCQYNVLVKINVREWIMNILKRKIRSSN